MLKITRQNVRNLTLYSALFWLPMLIFSGIANEITQTDTFPGDVTILKFINNHFPAYFSDVLFLVTNLGSAVGIVTMTGLIIAGLVKLNRRVAASVVLVSVAGAAIANFIIKLLFERDRPSLWQSVIQEQSFSFPSGHAMASSALYFAVVYAAWRTKWRWPVIITGGLFVLLVGFSRLYFGVHYPSDVVAGWLASFIWVCISVAALTRTNVSAYLKRLLKIS